MKKEYDLLVAEQGKFYKPIEELEIPVYLDKEIKAFYSKKRTVPYNVRPGSFLAGVHKK